MSRARALRNLIERRSRARLHVRRSCRRALLIPSPRGLLEHVPARRPGPPAPQPRPQLREFEAHLRRAYQHPATSTAPGPYAVFGQYELFRWLW